MTYSNRDSSGADAFDELLISRAFCFSSTQLVLDEMLVKPHLKRTFFSLKVSPSLSGSQEILR
jgi:hypothetical protein